MPRLNTSHPITAIVHRDGAAAAMLMRRLIARASAAGHTLAGLMEHSRRDAGDLRCEMELEDLASGALHPIFEDRGSQARGCRLDAGLLLHALEGARGALLAQPNLVVVNKFGKSEVEGGGLRPLVIEAMERAIPVLIGVPMANLEAWRKFAGEYCVEFTCPADENEFPRLCHSLGLQRGAACGRQWTQLGKNVL